MERLFEGVAMRPGHDKWEQAVSRQEKLYARQGDLRTDFSRDYNRILHSTAYRRLKHKTQVFFATQNDHICTRIEHVNHVHAVSQTIAEHLGLNPELTGAIAMGHDLGHAPFGHSGEKFIAAIARRDLGETFWHERNSLHFIDDIETLEGPSGVHFNLNLTYAVRDGIVCHCGEVDENAIVPRDEPTPLESLTQANQFAPFTWEGCVVKLADKIAYLGRDIEDAIRLKILNLDELRKLWNISRRHGETSIRHINSSLLMQVFINDLCRHSSPEKGLVLSGTNLELMSSLKQFNYHNIYNHERLKYFGDYAELIIRTIYERLASLHGPNALERVKGMRETCPQLADTFYEWLVKYGYPSLRRLIPLKYHADRLYNPEDESDYRRAILDYISGMTDSFAIRVFNEIISF